MVVICCDVNAFAAVAIIILLSILFQSLVDPRHVSISQSHPRVCVILRNVAFALLLIHFLSVV